MMVFGDVFLNLILQACQLTYFNRLDNWIEFIRTYSRLDLQLDQAQNFIMFCIYLSIQHVEELHRVLYLSIYFVTYLRPHEKYLKHIDKNFHVFVCVCVCFVVNENINTYL